MSIDRAKLEEALGYLLGRDGVISGAHSREGGDYGKCLTMLCALKAAAEAHLATLPKVKMVEVWRVEYARPQTETRGTEREAQTYAEKLQAQGATCIRVTGPHLQCVPA